MNPAFLTEAIAGADCHRGDWMYWSRNKVKPLRSFNRCGKKRFAGLMLKPVKAKRGDKITTMTLGMAKVVLRPSVKPFGAGSTQNTTQKLKAQPGASWRKSRAINKGGRA